MEAVKGVATEGGTAVAMAVVGREGVMVVAATVAALVAAMVAAKREAPDAWEERMASRPPQTSR
jgi:hypothetical protein